MNSASIGTPITYNGPAARVSLDNLPIYHEGAGGSRGGRGGGVKLSSNENAAPVPRFIRRAIGRAGRGGNRYPPKYAGDLVRAIANRFDVDEACITLGNGSDELMGLIGQAYIGAGDEVLLGRHTFSIYTHVARVAGAVPVVAEMRGETVDVNSILTRVSARTKVVFLATPNNPTGGYITVNEMRAVCAGIPAAVLIVVDHAYADFCAATDFCTAEQLIPEHSNVVTLRTFSKLYGMAGLRIGYAISHPHIANQLNRIRMPFNINRCAMEAAMEALSHHKYFARQRDRVIGARDAMRRRIMALGYRALETHGNFICLHLPHEAEEMTRFFHERKIAVRPLDSFGLPNHVRITVTTARVNALVLRTLARYAQTHEVTG